jgi:hypothetical protein
MSNLNTHRGPAWGTGGTPGSRTPAVVNMSVAHYVTNCQANQSDTTFQNDASYLEHEINALLGYTYNSSTDTFSRPYYVQDDSTHTFAWYGIPVVVSANNFNTSATRFTPSRMAYSNSSFYASGHEGGHVISVGAIDEATPDGSIPATTPHTAKRTARFQLSMRAERRQPQDRTTDRTRISTLPATTSWQRHRSILVARRARSRVRLPSIASGFAPAPRSRRPLSPA